jgi:hypothetical protein
VVGRGERCDGMSVKVFAYNPRRELRRPGKFLFESGVTI